MNVRLVFLLIGKLLMIEGGLMVPSLLVALYYAEGDVLAFGVTIVLDVYKRQDEEWQVFK